MGPFPSSKFQGQTAPHQEHTQDLLVSAKGWHRRVNRHAEKGAGHLKAILWTGLLIVLIYVAVKVIPVLINEYQFQDSLQEIARFASVNRKTPEQLKQAVMEVAQKQDLPVEIDNIKVGGNGGNVRINVDYSVTVDLMVYQWTLNFHPSASNNSLL